MAEKIRVVVVIQGGMVQNILANSEEVEVLIKDYDCEGSGGEHTDDEGGDFNAITGPHEVDDVIVSACFESIKQEG